MGVESVTVEMTSNHDDQEPNDVKIEQNNTKGILQTLLRDTYNYYPTNQNCFGLFWSIFDGIILDFSIFGYLEENMVVRERKRYKIQR